VNIFECFGNVMSIKTKGRDRVGKKFTSILYEGALLCSNEFKDSINSFNISGFICGFISPFDGITNKFGSTFNNVHDFIGSFSSCFNTSDDGHWVNKVLDVKTSI